MSSRLPLTAVVAGVILFAAALRGEEKSEIVIGAGAGAGWVINGQPFGMGAMGIDQFMAVVTQLNMTPELTLDVGTKQKLQDVMSEWRKANAKYQEDQKDELKKIRDEQMEGFKAQDQAKISEAGKKYSEILAKGPKSDEFLVKAKAALTPEQLKVVDARIQKDKDDQKAMMEKFRANRGGEAKEE